MENTGYYANLVSWSYEAKLDGYRCLAAKHSGGVVL
jgi:ATP-dependent DNA ligase